MKISERVIKKIRAFDDKNHRKPATSRHTIKTEKVQQNQGILRLSFCKVIKKVITIPKRRKFSVNTAVELENKSYK